ncbi:MAG: spore coat protein [Bacillota bacterium]
MINDNIVALDALTAEKHIVKDLTSAIIETSNPNLKETLLQIRNQAEQEHQEIYQIAEQNGWYMAAGNAAPQQMNEFQQFFQQRFINDNSQTQANMSNRNQTKQQPQYRAQQQNNFQNNQSSRQYTYSGRQNQNRPQN